MGAPSKAQNIQLVRIQYAERLATNAEGNSMLSEVTN